MEKDLKGFDVEYDKKSFSDTKYSNETRIKVLEYSMRYDFHVFYNNDFKKIYTLLTKNISMYILVSNYI